MIRKTLLFVMLVGISVFKVNAQSTWFPLQSGTDKTLYGVDFFNENTGIAVGNKGIILKTTDGGATWEQKDAGVGVALNSVSFIDKYHAIIVGNGGLMLKTEDGGNTWTQEYIQNISEADLLSIDMEPSGKGIVCGRYMTILTTQDMGTTWLVLRKNYIGAFYSARILNNNIAFVFGENSISNSFVMAIAHYDSLSTARYFYVYNGNAWAEGKIYDGYGWGKDSVITAGCVVSSSGPWWMSSITNNQSWDTEYWYPCFSVDSSYFSGIDFGGNYGVAVGGRVPIGGEINPSSCIISESYDKGNSWEEVQSPLLDYPFYDVKLIDNSGYIVGESGVILKKDITGVGIISPGVDNNVKIFPNPVSDKCTISFLNKEKQNIKIDLYTLEGKHINSIINKELPFGQQVIDIPVNMLSNGLYYCTIIIGKQIITKKISITK